MPPLLTWLLLLAGGYTLVYGVFKADKRVDRTMDAEFDDANRRERALDTMGHWHGDRDQAGAE